MSTRYDDRDNERQRNYGRRSESEYDRSSGDPSQWYGRNESERDRHTGESRWRGQSGGRYSSGSGREYQSGRGDYGTGGWESDRDYGSERRYGSYGRGYDTERRYGDTSSTSSQRYNYPTGFRSGETYGYGEGRGGYDYERGGYGSGEGRSWWDRVSDTVASWFGDEDAERRRRMDEQRQQYRGRGPKGYRRSDDRIREDINDRLSEGYLDASDIEVAVQSSEVTLTGAVNSRRDKRLAEAIAEDVTGVTNVENRIRVRQSGTDQYSSLESTSTTQPTSTSTSATTGTGGTARSRTAGT